MQAISDVLTIVFSVVCKCVVVTLNMILDINPFASKQSKYREGFNKISLIFSTLSMNKVFSIIINSR